MEIRAENEILILDFDHTLFLSNSTEEYLNSAKPRTLVALILALLDWFKVWNLFPGENKRTVYRNAIHVICISILFPWSYFFYKQRAVNLVAEYLNSDIVKILESKIWKKVIIASNGFDFIIQPLLTQMNIQVDVILSSQILTTQNGIRATGKQVYLQKLLTYDELQKSTFISDNLEDKDLKNIVNEFIFYEHPKAKQLSAGQNIYIPFAYTHKSKRGNTNHLLNVVLLEDYPFILVAYGFSNPISIQLFISILLVLLSFWCIYEACYFENDLYELRYESKHNNADKIEYIKKKQNSPFEVYAWIWAAMLALSGLLILAFKPYEAHNLFSYELLIEFITWMIFLIILRLIFRAYTYSSSLYRVAISPALQIARLVGPSLFLSINFYGAFFIVARALSRWFSYSIYRAGGDRKAISQPLIRHLIFVILIASIAIVEKDIRVLISLQFVLTLCFSVIRGHLRSLVVKLSPQEGDTLSKLN
ncbi:hypothetical protein [Acaryochloris sp. IP29b_bin.148]|uniref:hypothetical protein n=1 Tax=Acaryochloris sp. IP29b_bin.148 TaxID=2969218 RepID=UPI002636BEA8|nr:hypothetical protein [Acaryochloris sp. IP29b_bin.148]